MSFRIVPSPLLGQLLDSGAAHRGMQEPMANYNGVGIPCSWTRSFASATVAGGRPQIRGGRYIKYGVSTGPNNAVLANKAANWGKWYYEITFLSAPATGGTDTYGWANVVLQSGWMLSQTGVGGGSGQGYGFGQNTTGNTTYYQPGNANNIGAGITIAAGDTIMLAINIRSTCIYMGYNGAWFAALGGVPSDTMSTLTLSQKMPPYWYTPFSRGASNSTLEIIANFSPASWKYPTLVPQYYRSWDDAPMAMYAGAVESYVPHMNIPTFAGEPGLAMTYDTIARNQWATFNGVALSSVKTYDGLNTN